MLDSKSTDKLRKKSSAVKPNTNRISKTKSEGALPMSNNAEVKRRLRRKEKAKRRAQDELVTLFGTKNAGSSVEFNKKLSSYVKRFGKLEVPEENAEIKENVKNLLINKRNEIDIERIMALHLLSIRPAKKCYRLQFIEESNDGEDDDDESRKLTRYSEILPNYIIVSGNLNHCDCFKDINNKRTKSTFMHISINSRIEELINATLEAIRKSNPTKLENLWLQAFDTNNVKKLLNRERFRYLLTSMKNNLKCLFDNADVKTEMCDLREGTFYRVNKYRDYKDNTVFKIILPELICKEILFDDIGKYYVKIADIGLRMVKGYKYLLPEDGLCIFQNPTEPAGIIVIAENGQFISLINGPEFHYNNSDRFSNIAMYVLFHSGVKDRRKEWEEIVQNKRNKKRNDKNEMEEECSDEKLNEVTRKYIMKRIIKSLGKDERRIFASKYGYVKRFAKSDENVEIKFAQILKDVISIHRILRYLSEFTLKERQLAMKSSNYGGLGFARVILGRNTIQVIKDMCSRPVTQFQVTPIHNTNVLDTELKKINLKIPENIDPIFQELYNFEHRTANKLFLTAFETNKVKTFKQ